MTADVSEHQVDIGTVVASHLRSLGPVPVDAGTLGRVVDDAFFTIPRDQITDVTHEYAVPREMVDDDAAIEGYHAHRLVQAIAESIRDGYVVVELPVRYELPRKPYEPPNLVRFKLVARARRITPEALRASLGATDGEATS